MSRRVVGLGFLNVAGALVIVGALYDLLVSSVPPNHLAYVGAADDRIDPRYAARLPPGTALSGSPYSPSPGRRWPAGCRLNDPAGEQVNRPA